MITVPLITMDSNSRSLGTFLDKFKDIINFESYNHKILDGAEKVVVFFEYVGDNEFTFTQFTNFFKSYNIPTLLVIDDSYEGLADKNFIKLVEQTVDKNPAIKDWVILTNNKILDTENKIHFNVQLFLDRYDGIDVNKHIGTDWNGNSNLRRKKFLCLNRQERLHRLEVTDFLLEYDIAKHTYLSCPLGNYQYVLDGTLEQQEHRKYLDKSLQNANLSEETVQRLKANLPINLDLDETTYKSMARNLPDGSQYYAESYFSIITEGDFDDVHRQAFTEKVLKCFLFKHPFIVVGLQDTLKQLRELGFITFNSVIDESYDELTFAHQRLKNVKDELIKLNSLNIHELRDMYNELKPVLDYNRQHYLNLFQQKQPVELLHKIKSFVND